VDILARMRKCGVIPVVVIDDVKDALPAAAALLAGGVDVIEVTLRTKAGLEAIRVIARDCPDILVGAGTVLTLEQAQACAAAGARFIVSPGLNREMVAWCNANGLAVTPGAVTPTEIMVALELGIKIIKFFPANIYGGLAAMKALAAPFTGVRFIPTGGVHGQNLAEYLREPYVYAVGGSWICSKEDIKAQNFARITGLCKEAREIVADIIKE
jgi:2-dehydro-3-deoxyphosphogluconate aldolase / (4S)-4-hydroxy-2-oxoglutarate aldolase